MGLDEESFAFFPKKLFILNEILIEYLFGKGINEEIYRQTKIFIKIGNKDGYLVECKLCSRNYCMKNQERVKNCKN